MYEYERPDLDAPARGEKSADWWRCADVVRGQRCGKAGTVSHGTRGGGPFYCIEHAFPQGKLDKPPAGTIELIKSLAHKLGKSLSSVDPEEASERAAIQFEQIHVEPKKSLNDIEF